MTDALVIPEGYTPGPWRVTGEGAGRGQIAHDHGGNVAFACLPRRVDESREDGESWLDMCRRTDPERVAIDDEMDANAALIALAPAMAAEIDRLRAEVERLTRENADWQTIAETHNEVMDAKLTASEAERDRLREALGWYAEQVAGCRKITREGDLSRAKLDADGGSLARAALSPATGEGS